MFLEWCTLHVEAIVNCILNQTNNKLSFPYFKGNPNNEVETETQIELLSTKKHSTLLNITNKKQKHMDNSRGKFRNAERPIPNTLFACDLIAILCWKGQQFIEFGFFPTNKR